MEITQTPPFSLLQAVLLVFCCCLSCTADVSAQNVQIPLSPAGKGLILLLSSLNSEDIKPGEVLTANLPTSINTEQTSVLLNQPGGLELVKIFASDELSMEFELQFKESQQKLVGALLVDDKGKLETVDLRVAWENRLYLGYKVAPFVSTGLLSAFPAALARYNKPELIPTIVSIVKDEVTTTLLKDTQHGITLAEKLTDVLQTASEDRQLQVFFSPHARRSPTPPAPPGPPTSPAPETDIDTNRLRYQCGFDGIGKMEGDIAYLRMHGFASQQNCAGIIDELVLEVSSSPALILDLTNASFGDPTTAIYLASHFFKDGADFSDLSIAPSGQRLGFIALKLTQGPLLAEQKIYVLVSGKTSQIGEALAHDLQRLDRALIVGEPTEGLSDLTITVYLDERFGLRVPNARYITPEGESLSGKRLIPDVPVLANQALSRAAAMARSQTRISADTQEAIPGD